MKMICSVLIAGLALFFADDLKPMGPLRRHKKSSSLLQALASGRDCSSSLRIKDSSISMTWTYSWF